MYNFQIENFKCFTNKNIPLNQLTVLAGANGNGKSTVIQALLFLRRTIEHCAVWEGKMKGEYYLDKANGLNVDLNGSYCLSLGSSDMIIPRNMESDFIAISFDKENESLQIVYDLNTENQLWLKPIDVPHTFHKGNPLFKQEFYYLNAERIGPRISQGIKFFDFPSAGYQGEYVAQLISDTNTNYKLEVDKKRRNDSSKSPRLEQQVNAWLNEIMPGVSITASFNTDTHTAQIRVDNFYTKGDSTIATNIGFGISYVLPIIVTGLIAKENTIFIVENPEAHLHPSAQSKIGKFLAMVANAGVKVIIETHSDHVVNGIQISCVKKIIPFSDVIINFFSQEDGKEQPSVESISITSKGELTKWPKGFFDQSQKDFAELLKFRKMINLFLLNDAIEITDYEKAKEGILELIQIDRHESDTFYKHSSIYNTIIYLKLCNDPGYYQRYILEYFEQLEPSLINYSSNIEINDDKPYSHNAFLGIDFSMTVISENTQISNQEDYIKFRTEKLENVDFRNLWQIRDQLFSNLILCGEVRAQLSRIGNNSFYKQLVTKLIEFNKAVSNWKTGNFSYKSFNQNYALRISPESMQTMDNYSEDRIFRMPNGTTQVFELHIKTGELRFHFFPDNTTRKVYVGYIGPHLRTFTS